MAEFCLECWNELNGTDEPESNYILSEDLELCEGCGEWKNVILLERTFGFSDLFRNHFFFYRRKKKDR